MPGLVKIGLTTRYPDERGQELSSATGVASPFTVHHYRLVSDCYLAEKAVHALLTQKGLRAADNREFFMLSAQEAVEYVDQVVALDDEVGRAQLADRHMKIGFEFGEGSTEVIADQGEAERHFRLAAELGSADGAYCAASLAYQRSDLPTALRFYRLAAQLGQVHCLSDCGSILEKVKQAKDAKVYWDQFLVALQDGRIAPAMAPGAIWTYLFHNAGRDSCGVTDVMLGCRDKIIEFNRSVFGGKRISNENGVELEEFLLTR